MSLIRNLLGNMVSKPAKEQSELATTRPQLTPQAWLNELFKRHGVTSTTQDDWVLPNAELPGVRGVWHPSEKHGRLDIQVLVRNGVVIEESFGGIGAGDLGLADGLQNFTINSFHVLLSALWRHHHPDQVEAEAWTVAGRRFIAFIGNVGTRSSTDAAPLIPAGMLTLLREAIQSEPLEHNLHWFRFYVGHVKGDFTFEALKDNEPWPKGMRALEACGWATRDAFYSARMFVVLREECDEVQSSEVHPSRGCESKP
ncbi:DUF6348 family protein [Ideonella sp. DXS29W]|uniref:DUF6348 family protein n=1 Tax=Ideonella lacteola TaxID=2984193 RepID=A0ABU9BL24_9BURK